MKRHTSPKHLRWLHTLPCLISKQYGVDLHHLLRLPGYPSERGIARKAGDRWAVPLRHDIHMELHSMGEEAFKAKHDAQLMTIAAKLWWHSGDSQFGEDLIGGRL